MCVAHLLKARLIELRLVDNLNGNLLSRGQVLGQLHLGKVALAYCLEEPVAANLGLLIARHSRITAQIIRYRHRLVVVILWTKRKTRN